MLEMKYLVFSLNYSRFRDIYNGNHQYIIKRKLHRQQVSEGLIYVNRKGIFAKFHLSEILTGPSKNIYEEIKFYITYPEQIFYQEFAPSEIIHAYRVNDLITFKTPLLPDAQKFRPNMLAYINLSKKDFATHL